MASCNGLSHLFLPCSLKTRPGSAKIGKREPAVGVVSAYGAGNRNGTSRLEALHQLLSLQAHPDKFKIEYEQKIEEIRQVLQSKGEDESSESLVLVDAIQRVGLSSYYEEETQTLLRKRYVTSCASTYRYYSLRDVSLLFRLLRQHGHYISPDIFNNFKGKDGRFRRNLSQDIRGLMELYEAAQLSFQGEYILDEAASFSSQLLHDIAWQMLTTTCSLRYLRLTSRRKTEVRKLEERSFKGAGSLDTTGVHLLYHRGIRWWNELGLAQKLKLVRNQPPKWYTWSMSILIDDFSLSPQRVALTKSVTFIT
ncbi:Tricyclene synthase Oc15, chloroplastic [Sesamum angolense]|uniref:Tricyclene synthase Oc15, chloroplastic n=1 Tax=Sesamum angolense TaxID=2727404 RepID=A0AAE2BV59_9LAMI|nr:Tricyclene synthase Oc15, chloroplastic [Sesamum angolense]